MTRKALRKRLRTQAKQASRASIPRSAIALEDRRRPGGLRGPDDGAIATPASAAEVFSDPRLRIVHELLRTSAWSLDDCAAPVRFRVSFHRRSRQLAASTFQPGPLADVLNRFEQATGVKVIVVD